MDGVINELCVCGCKSRRAGAGFPHNAKVRLRRHFMILTAAAVVVHQNDLFEQVRRSPLDGCVDGAQQHRQGLVDKDEDDAKLRKI